MRYQPAAGADLDEEDALIGGLRVALAIHLARNMVFARRL